MRFMIIVRSNTDSEAGVLPTSEQLATMGVFNEELINAGILLAAEGLQATSKGALITFGKGGKSIVKDGPFTESKEIVGGFWIIQVKSKDEALAWIRRAPMEEGDVLELRQVFEVADFPSDSVIEEYLSKEQAWRDANQKPLSN
jgi:hypothetical protein